MLFKAVAVCEVIMLAETLHGAVRVKLLNPRVGYRCAQQVGVFAGSLVFILITWATLPRIGVSTIGECLIAGLAKLRL